MYRLRKSLTIFSTLNFLSNSEFIRSAGAVSISSLHFVQMMCSVIFNFESHATQILGRKKTEKDFNSCLLINPSD